MDSARLCWKGFSLRANIVARYVWFSAVLRVAVPLKRTCADPIVVTSRNSQYTAAKRVLRIFSPRELCTTRVTASCVTLSPSGNSSSFATPKTPSLVLPERAFLMVIIGYADNLTRFFQPIPTVFSSRLPRTVVLSCILSLLLRQQRVVDVAASKEPTVAAAAERSRANVEIGHGHSGTLAPCIRSIASAGHLVVYFVTVLMVGDRRFPRATVLGGEISSPSANHPLSAPPTSPELRDALLCGRCTRWQALNNSVSVQVVLCTFLLSLSVFPFSCVCRSLTQLAQRQRCTCASSSAFVRFSSPFHENSVVTQHSTAGLFHHRKTARAPTQETSKLACPEKCGVVLFACRSWCSWFSFSGFFSVLSGRVVHSRDCFFSLGLQGETN